MTDEEYVEAMRRGLMFEGIAATYAEGLTVSSPVTELASPCPDPSPESFLAQIDKAIDMVYDPTLTASITGQYIAVPGVMAHTVGRYVSPATVTVTGAAATSNDPLVLFDMFYRQMWGLGPVAKPGYLDVTYPCGHEPPRAIVGTVATEGLRACLSCGAVAELTPSTKLDAIPFPATPRPGRAGPAFMKALAGWNDYFLTSTHTDPLGGEERERDMRERLVINAMHEEEKSVRWGIDYIPLSVPRWYVDGARVVHYQPPGIDSAIAQPGGGRINHDLVYAYGNVPVSRHVGKSYGVDVYRYDTYEHAVRWGMAVCLCEGPMKLLLGPVEVELRSVR